MTGREAEAVLGRAATLGPPLGRRHARRVLATGLAGTPERVGRVLLHDTERVEALARWPVLDETRVEATCPDLLVLRRDVDVTAPRADIVAALQDGWELSPWTRVALRVQIERCPRGLPVVSTTSGFVTAGAELTDVRVNGVSEVSGRETSRLVLIDPGEWFETLRNQRYPTGPGRPWWIRGWPPTAA